MVSFFSFKGRKQPKPGRSTLWKQNEGFQMIQSKSGLLTEMFGVLRNPPMWLETVLQSRAVQVWIALFKWNIKPAFCIYAGYFCLISQFVWWSAKWDKHAKKKAKYKINNGKKVLFTWANVLLTCMWSAEFINQWNQHVNIYTRRVLPKRHKCRKDIHTVIPTWKISIFKVQAETFSRFLTRTLTVIDRMSRGALNITHVGVKSFIWSLRVNREPTVQINTGFDGGPVLPWALELVDPHLIIMFVWICFIFCQ